MKKIYLYNFLAATMLFSVCSSCKDALNISPVDTVDQSKALLTSKDVEVALVGAYADLGSRNFYGGRPFLMADFMANTGAIDWGGTFEELTQANTKLLLKTNIFVNNVWAAGYTAINDANNVLAAISKVEAAKKNRVEGEAKFIRAAAYFDLVRLFGKAYNDGSPSSNLGVPLVLTPTNGINEQSYVSRATVSVIYNQVISDLTDAESKLPPDNGFFASKYTAAAMLARVYLQMANYPAAGAAADRVISSGKFTLKTPFADAFPKIGSAPGSNTSEDIFSMQVTNLTGFNAYNEFYGSASYGGRGDAIISQNWIDNTYDPDDDRKNAFYDDDDDIFTAKFANQYGNVSIIRLAEMYLIRAECNARLAPAAPIGGQTPLQDLSVIRGRANLTTTTASVSDIINERQLEFAFEGFSLHDAKRTQTNIGSIPWNDNRLVFPIPQREMDANKKLTQNPGYN